MPRKDLSISEKIAILELIKKQPSNTSQRRLAEITGVPKSTVARIVQQQHKILHELTLYTKGERRLYQKRKREGKDPDVEEALSQWFSIVNTQGLHVTGPVLKSKSEEFAKMLGHNDFKATDGWLSRWKSRFGIKFKKLSGEKGNAEQWNSIKLPNLLKKFEVKGICNNNNYNNNNNDETSKELKDEDTTTPEDEKVSHQVILNHVDGLPYFRQEGMEESRNEKLQYQMTSQVKGKPAALGKMVNAERSETTPLNTASTCNSTLTSKTIEVDSSPPNKKAREIPINVGCISEDKSTVVSKPPLQPAIPVEPSVQKSMITSVKPTFVVHNPVVDIKVFNKQKHILVVPNHQQSVMSNLSSLWKTGKLCDAFIGNGTTNLKVHKMILGAVCPKVLDVFYETPLHKLPKVTFPSSVSKEALLAFAEYIYNGVLDLDPDLLTQMKVIAKQLDMKDFEQLCNNQLKSSSLPNMLPTIFEPMLTEPCSSSGLIQQMSLEGSQTSVMDTSAPIRSQQKDVHIDDTLNSRSSTTNNSVNSFSNSLLEIRAETSDTLMEAGDNNLVPSIVHNTCDVNINSRLQIKTEEVDSDDQQFDRETLSSVINYSTPESIITDNFTLFSNTDLSQSFSSPASTSQHHSLNTIQHKNTSQHHTLNKIQHNTQKNTSQHNTLNISLPVSHMWKQNNEDKRNMIENTNQCNPYPISLFTANWANVPLLTQEIKKEYED